MGKVFLLLILAGLVWGAMGVVDVWNQHFQFDQDKPAQAKPAEIQTTVAPVQEKPLPVTPPEPKPEKLSWSAITDAWVWIDGEGKVQKGQELACGWMLTAWDHLGAWLSKGGETIRVRWESAGQKMARVAEEVAKVRPVVTAAAVNPLAGIPEIGGSEKNQ